MKIRLTRVLLVALLLPNPLRSQASRVGCFRYDTDTVSLRGEVIRRVYPGRPNYESVAQGDAPDTVFVLRLTRPICVAADSQFDARAGVREVQLYFPREAEARIRSLRGRRTEFRGTLLEAVWGWHHLPVLLWVREQQARALPPRAA